MQRVRHLLQQPGFHVLGFILFLFVSAWPILSIPGKGQLVSFFIYVFSVWTLMILTLFLLSKRLGSINPDDSEVKQEPGGTRRV